MGISIKDVSEYIMRPFNVLTKVTFNSGGNTFHYMYEVADGTLVAFHTGTGDITISQPGMYDGMELIRLFKKDPYKEYSSEEKADEALDKFWDPKRLESKAVYEGILYDNNLTPEKIEIIREKIGGKRFAKGGELMDADTEFEYSRGGKTNKFSYIAIQTPDNMYAYFFKDKEQAVKLANSGELEDELGDSDFVFGETIYTDEHTIVSGNKEYNEGFLVYVTGDVPFEEGFEIEDCIDAAYTEIAARTGKMINGTFVKDAD